MGIRDSEKYAWLALYLIPGLGNLAFKNLLDRFGSPRAVFLAGLSELKEVTGLRDAVARKIVKREYAVDPEKEYHKIESINARIVTFFDKEYPKILKEIHSPPMLLYVKGKRIPEHQNFISLVGSRRATHYGIKSAEKIALGLARRGVGVVSGLAIGIDTAAHRGCLWGKGFTIAVIGTGLDIVYPSSNREMIHQIQETGSIVSEFPLGSPPEPKNFPIRNRVISGLSRGVVIVEATRNSGSLITASLALEQGREVFAVPGSIDSFKSRGAHFLIKQGALLVENADDILDELGYSERAVEGRGSPEGFPESVSQMNQSEKKIFEIIGDYPIHIDEVARMGKMDTSEVSSILLELEIKGVIRQLAGKMFIR
jgi:DNA processing protein